MTMTMTMTMTMSFSHGFQTHPTCGAVETRLR
jgi:hypothetical protein